MEFFEGNNIGGLSSIEIIEHFNIRSLKPLNLVAGKDWTLIPFKDESGQMVIRTADTDNGPVYTYSGRFFIHNMRDEVDQAMENFIGQKSIMRITDMNGRSYLIGAPGKPVTLLPNGDTGQRYVNENGMDFNFNIEQDSPAIVV